VVGKPVLALSAVGVSASPRAPDFTSPVFGTLWTRYYASMLDAGLWSLADAELLLSLITTHVLDMGSKGSPDNEFLTT
jgi:hypothetical protein